MVSLGADWLHVDVMVRPRRRTSGAALLPGSKALASHLLCMGPQPGHAVAQGTSRARWRKLFPRRPLHVTPPRPAQDGHFVPNLTLGAPIVKSLRRHTPAFLDVHLMVSNPAQASAPLWLCCGCAGAALLGLGHAGAALCWQKQGERGPLRCIARAARLGGCHAGQARALQGPLALVRQQL